jgi:hypothetical protein
MLLNKEHEAVIAKLELKKGKKKWSYQLKTKYSRKLNYL